MWFHYLLGNKTKDEYIDFFKYIGIKDITCSLADTDNKSRTEVISIDNSEKEVYE